MRSEVFKILRKVTANSVNVILFKYVVSVGGGGVHCDYLPRAPKRTEISHVLHDFDQIWSFWTSSQRSPMSDFSKIRSVVSALMHADKRTDEHDETNSRFFRLFERV
jgi:hypothetical protein